eukprot:CAMPEP_0194280252 /NCGR_PEP_ID=MMETSP0169-20130528/16546_1 /TAXON_ID=218684 /ORGANISM="Corethron pennatum, Strain L29A3" /LENGTH=319 /DNA_ID=CAMNT_0039024901 /DNA_START=76 /DNA_END=1035 /DNA_ORIENTATION=+
MISSTRPAAALCALSALVLSAPAAIAFSPLYGAPAFVARTSPFSARLPDICPALRSSPNGDDTDAEKSDNNEMDRIMYTLGIELGLSLGDLSQLTENSEERTHVVRGLVDVCGGRIDNAGCEAMLSQYGGKLKEVIRERATRAQQQLAMAGTQMLAEMAAQPNAVSLPSGVVVQVIDEESDTTQGTGLAPSATSSVQADYHGTFPDGTVFDSSLGTNRAEGEETPKFALAGVIPGWKEGFQQLVEGQVAMLGIPPEMAYGAKGTPDGAIPPNSTLFFKVRLEKVLTAGVSPSGLVGADGNALTGGGASVLLGADGKPMF